MAHESDAKYDKIVMAAVAGAAATGPSIVVAPIVDVGAVAGVWTVMAMEIAKKNNVTLDKKSTGKVIMAALTGMGAYRAGAKIFLTVIGKIPGAGMVLGSGINSAANVATTLWFAYGLIDLFEGDLEGIEDHFLHLVAELKPRASREKVARVRAFIKRQRRRR